MAERRGGTDAARLGRRDLRPRRRPDDPLGRGVLDRLPAAGRRDRARRRLRQRPGHRAARRAPAGGPRRRARRLAVDARGRARAARAVRRPGDVRRRGPRARRCRSSRRAVDAILSTATFHWVPDHAPLFRHLAAVAPPGRPARRPVRRRRQHRVGPARRCRRSATAGRARGPSPRPTRRARGSRPPGFADTEAWLNDEPTRVRARRAVRGFLRTVVLGAHLARLPDAERDAFVDEVADAPPRRRIDYVRLNVLATRAADAAGVRLALDAERAAVAGDHDVGGREDPRAVGLDRAWSGAERVDLGRPVRAPPEVGHRVDAVVGLDDERRVLLGVAGRQPQLGVRARADSRRRRGPATGRPCSAPRSRRPRRSGTARR